MGLREQAFNVTQLWPGILKFSPDDYRTDVDEDDLQEFYDHSTMCPPDYTEDFKEFALTIRNEHQFPEPHDVNSALARFLYETPKRGGKLT